MITAIYLQRRRILFGMLFFFLAGVLDFGASRGADQWIAVLVLSSVFALITGAIGAILIPLFSAYRQVFEISAVTFFLLRIMDRTPLAGASDSLLNTTWGFFVLAVGYTLLFHAVYGAWWERTSLRLAWTGRSGFRTTASQDAAWRHLVPQSDRPDEYYSGTLAGFVPVPDHEGAFLLRTRLGGVSFVEQFVRVVEADAPHRFAYDFTGEVSEENRDLHTGHWQIELTPEGSGTRVAVTERVIGTTVANALLFWFDDLGGQVAVSMKAMLEERHDPSILGKMRRQVAASV